MGGAPERELASRALTTAQRVEANLAAIRTLRTLQQEEDRSATEEERAALAGYRSWGAVPALFEPLDQVPDSLRDSRAELESLLSETEFDAARRTTLNAHFTAPRYAEAMWRLTRDLGFTQGRVLEPGCGLGTFMAAAPEGAQMVGVEMDPITAAIAGKLHPDHRVEAAAFQDVRLPTSSFTAVIGNVPFSSVKPHDPAFNPGRTLSLHDYFLVKSLRLTAPGGVVVALTSRWTLDKVNPEARRQMAALGELVGAVRLPGGAHAQVAGTEAVTDLVIFRRWRSDEAPEQDPAWTRTGDFSANDMTTRVSAYFLDHPDRVLGDLDIGHGMYGPGELLVRAREAEDVGATFERALAEVAESAREEGFLWRIEAAAEKRVAQVPAVDRGEGHIAAGRHGGFTQVVDGFEVELAVPQTQHEELRTLLDLRDAAIAVLDAEAASIDDSVQLANLRQALNVRYDAYAARFGPLNRYTLSESKKLSAEGEPITIRRYPPVMSKFRADPFSPLVFALENFDDAAQTASKSTIMRERVVIERHPRQGADTPAEAVAICQDTLGRIDLEHMGRLLGISTAQVPKACAGEIYQVPVAENWVSKAEYLSGNVRRKLAAAKAADLVDGEGRWAANVEALEAVQPADLGPDDITVRLGGAWLPEEDVTAFLRELVDSRHVSAVHIGGAEWTLNNKYGGSQTALTSEWGTPRTDTFKLIDSLLNQRTIQIYDEREGGGRVLNAEETTAAQEKADQIQERFGEWVWEDADRATRLARRYNDLFNNTVLREYHGDHLVFPGLAANWVPRPHQRAAVARMIAEPAVGLYHEVGAGKTAEMVMGVMELRRLGLVSKPAICVPNHMLKQFTNEFLQLYPRAQLLAASSDDLAGDKRRQFVARAATGDWDAIILTRGAFQRLDVGPEIVESYIGAELGMLRSRLERRSDVGASTKRTESQIAALEERLKAKLDGPRDAGITFEQTGIDYLCIDELHDYKNLATPSNIAGAGITGSARASDLHMKLHYLRDRYGDRVVTGATATPIANSITEAYVMQRYLRPDLLHEAGLEDFDAWAGTFGQVETGLEFTAAGQLRQKARFAKFLNVPELLKTWWVSGDVKTAEDLKLPVPQLQLNGDGERLPETVVIPRPAALEDYMAHLGERAEACQGRHVEPEEDNILVITSDGRKAALDLRLLSEKEQTVLEDLGYDLSDLDPEETKVAVAADNIARIWEETKDRRYVGADGEPHPQPGGFQMVFCDLGTPHGDGSFTVYEQMRDRLYSRGLPAGSVRFIHEAKNDAEKGRLFAACRDGSVAVLLGSTQKMGVGTNIQTRAVALHHMDCPWRPADLAQRDGRIVRQGNQNPEIGIYRYVTDRSFDATSWQTIARKAGFIGQVMRGKLDAREIEDIGDSALDATQVAALVSGDNRILIKAQLEADVHKLARLERNHARNQKTLERRQRELASGEATLAELIPVADRTAAAATPMPEDRFACTVRGYTYRDRADAAPALGAALAQMWTQRQQVLSLAGVEWEGQVAYKDITGEQIVEVAPAGLWHASTRLEIPAHDLSVPSRVRGFLTRIENKTQRLSVAAHDLHATLAKVTKERQRIAQTIGGPFKRAEELDEKRVQLRTLTAELARDLAATRAETDPGHETGEKSAQEQAGEQVRRVASQGFPSDGARGPHGVAAAPVRDWRRGGEALARD